MASPRRPWPAWAAGEYASLRRLARRAHLLAEKAQESRHQNIYLTIELLSRANTTGQEIANICKRLELQRAGERWPYWANRAVEKSKKSGLYIAAGARHALKGIDKDNWKMVGLGISTVLDYAGQIEAALLDGPAPTGANVAEQAEEIAERAFDGT
jgi:hypothetical protein